MFDFDHCAFRYRIHDLAVIKLSFPELVFQGALKGYEHIRTLKSVEKDCINLYSDILMFKKFSDIFNMLEITGADENEKQLIAHNAYHTLKDIIAY